MQNDALTTMQDFMDTWPLIEVMEYTKLGTLNEKEMCNKPPE
jgi:hypothetical protein